MSKPKHLVFQVLNFLHSSVSKDYPLLPVDHLLLITLAACNGKKGICPSTVGLADQVNLDKYYVERRLRHISNIGLISIKKRLGKRNQYEILLPFIPQDLSTGGDSQVTTEQILNEKSGDSQVTTVVTCRTESGDSQVTRYNKDITKTNREAAPTQKARGALLSGDFIPSEQSRAICEQKGLSLDAMKQKFLVYVTASGKSFKNVQAGFELFLLNEKTSNVVNLPVKAKSVPPFPDAKKCETCDKWEDKCRCRYSTQETAQRHLADIMQKLGMKSAYETTDGIGNSKN